MKIFINNSFLFVLVFYFDNMIIEANTEKCDYGIKIYNADDFYSVCKNKTYYDYRDGDLYVENINFTEDNYDKLLTILEGMYPANIYFNNCKFNDGLFESFVEAVPSVIKSFTVTNCKLKINEAKLLLEKFEYDETIDVSLSIKI